VRRLLRKSAAAAWASRWRVGLLLLVTTLVWCAHYDRWTIADWQLPTIYSGDAPEILAQLKASSEGDMIPLRSKVIERLGAPFGAHWNGFPTPDKLLMSALGILANVIGLFAAANAGLLLAQWSAALAFYFVARWLRCRWEWACAGALLFAYTYHTFHRGLGHYSIAFPWTVPPGLLTVWLVAQSRRLEWRSAGAIVCLASAFALGVSNPYNLFFWLQLMGWALVLQWFGQRRRVNIGIGVAAIALAGVVFVASNIEVWLYVQEPDGMPLIARNYGGTETYALKPMEMFIPPVYHRWEAMAFLSNRYVRWSEWRGEAYLPYLGVVGIVGLLWLGVASLRRIIARRALPGQALSAGWLVGYSTIGGLTNVAALVVGFQTFRATNRVAIFISALVLIFLVIRLSRLTCRWPAWTRLVAAMAVAAVGLLDQVPKAASAEVKAEIALRVNSDRKLGRELEAALPEGAMIFQLPVLGFPEVLPPFRLADYEHFRPFLTTSTLRFSYGAAKFRARSRWQRDLENVQPATLVKRLERYGFAALYLNRKGYEDRAERLLAELAALGYDKRIESTLGHQVVVLLHPDPKPMLPMGRALTFGQGWHLRPIEGVRWANRDAVMSYFNPHEHPITVNIELTLIAPEPREVAFQHRGQRVNSVHVGDAPARLSVQLVLPPGVNVFTLKSSEPPVRLGEGRYQLRTFGLHASSIKVISEGAEPAD
jgi:phosphoglycerol transferase